MSAYVLEYDSNNSGGDWWLDDADWSALEAAGWDVDWVKEADHRYLFLDDDGRWLGALARSATKSLEADTVSVAVDEGRRLITEWAAVTGENPLDLGCSCCGPPHSFVLRDAGGGWVHCYEVDVPTEGAWADD